MSHGELELIRDAAPPTGGPSPQTLARVRSELADAWAPGPAAPSRRRSRWSTRRTALLLPTAAVLAGGAALAVTSLSDEAARTAGVVCARTMGDQFSGMPSATGDPVLDCAARWREAFGTAAPALVAYAGARGDILVLPASEPAPAGAIRLARGFHQDAAVLQMSHELDDVARGVAPAGGCRSAAGARRLADAQMARLGLTGWTVAFQGPRADGASSCAGYALDPVASEIVIVAGRGPRSGSPQLAAMAALSRRLTGTMISGTAARCTSGTAAQAQVRHALAALPKATSAGVVVSPDWAPGDAPDGAETCVRPAVSVTGVAFVHLDTVTRASFEAGRAAKPAAPPADPPSR